MPPLRRDPEEFRYQVIRLQFDETFVTCRPAHIGANAAYAKAMIDFRINSPHRLAMAAAIRQAQDDPESVTEEAGRIALREHIKIYVETVIANWEGPGDDDPAAWLAEHPEDFEALIGYCTDLEIFRKGVSANGTS